MSGFELRAKFYPRVPTLAQLIEEAQEGVDYPFAVHQILQLRPKDYSKLCRDLDKEYGFERMLPEEKRQVVANLNQKGAFFLKGAVGLVARRLGVSEQTIYRYLRECEG